VRKAIVRMSDHPSA